MYLFWCFFLLISVFFLIFWSNWIRVLVTGRSCYSLRFLLWGFGDLESSVPVYQEVKPKTFSKVEVQKKGTEGVQVLIYWRGYKECLWAMGFILPWVPSSDLASCKTTGAVCCGEGISAGRQITYLFFQLVWTVPGQMESDGFMEKGWSQGKMMEGIRC